MTKSLNWVFMYPSQPLNKCKMFPFYYDFLLFLTFAEILSKTYEKPVPFWSRYFFNKYVTPGSPPRKMLETTPGPVKMTPGPTTPVDKVDSECKCVVFFCFFFLTILQCAQFLI